jgi:Reverse transcriptase (RNA-dependent DNA polymerase)/GAG-pre-integrase domain
MAVMALRLLWSLTIFTSFYLYTPLSTIVRAASAATPRTPSQVADAVMTAGAILLPGIVLMLALVAGIIAACAITILSEFYPVTGVQVDDTRKPRRTSSPTQQWMFRRAADTASAVGKWIETTIQSIRTQRRRQQSRSRRPPGNSARWTAMQRAGRLSRRGSRIQPRTMTDKRQVIAELEAAMTADKQTTVAMAAAYKSMHDGHRYDSDSKVMAIDNCCSKCITNDLTDFIETPTKVNMRVQGIGGTVTATLCGTVRWDIEDDDGISHQQIIPGTYYNPDSKYKLYSPQHVAQVANDNHPRPHGTWCATYNDSVVLQWNQRKYTRTVLLDKKTNVALMRSATGYQKFAAFCNTVCEDEPLVACLHTNQTDPSQTEAETCDDQSHPNDESPDSALRRHPDLPDEVFLRDSEQPIDHEIDTPLFDLQDAPTAYEETKAQMLEWHCRLGHLPFNKIQELAKRGDLPSKFAKCPAPVCGACLYAKKTRRPWRGRPTSSIHTRVATAPGDIVAVDQMVSPTPGLVAQMKGFITKQRYTAVTVFVDHYSNLSFTYLQKGLTIIETLEAKASFERYASAHGVTIRHYQTDNGIFETDSFRRSVEMAGQTISYAGVNVHHQNGHAEGKIRDLQAMGRAMLLHAAHRWPAAVTANLWPYAVRMANDSINAAPQVDTGQSPMERFTQVDVAPRVHHSHTFGCPVYVLDAHLQTAGGQIDKWKERSRVGLYLGASPQHSKRVALVLNLQTRHVSPQFHITFDDNFETIRSGSLIPISQWQSKTGFRKGSTKTSGAPDDSVEPHIPHTEVLFRPSDFPGTAAADNADSNNGGAIHQDDDHSLLDRSESERAPSATVDQGQAGTNESTASTNPSNQYSTRSGRRPVPTTRWLESQQQQQDGLLALTVTWEVFHDGGYDIQRELSDPIAFLGSTDTELTIQDGVVAMAASSSPDVMYMDQALCEPEGEQFRRAMADEVAAHTDNEHWEIIPRSLVPSGTKVLPAVWAMRRKRRLATGEPYKWKARLNVHGGKQEYGVNYWETYAPVIAWDTIRLFLVLALLNKWATRQIDFVLVYPQADIECPIYMDIPSQFEYQGSRKDHCLLLKKNLYGQKQAGRVWNQYLHDGLLARGFRQSSVDMCLYYRRDVALLIYTDDGILIGPTPADLDAIIALFKAPVVTGGKQTHRSFNITDEGTLDEYLGVKVEHLANGTIKLSQPQLIQQVVNDLGFNERTTEKDSPAASTVRLHRDISGKPYADNWHYRSIIGKLNFLEKSTQPDIAYAVHQCARFCLEPKESHATAVKRIGKYLLSTKDKGMILNPMKHSFDCYVDADFVGNWNRVTADVDPGTAKSRTAFIISHAGCPVAWASKLQTEVALSSTEAEYNALSESLRHVRFLMQIVDEAKEVGWKTFEGAPTVHCKVFEDNSGALEMSRLPKMRPRTKHLCVRLHHFREHVRLGKISIQHVASENQLADIATKPQPTALFVAQRESILQWDAEHKLAKDLQPVALATIQLHGCDIPRSRRTVRFEQLDAYPRTTGTQSGTRIQDRVKELAGKLLQGYYKNGQPGTDKRSKDERSRKRPRT